MSKVRNGFKAGHLSYSSLDADDFWHYPKLGVVNFDSSGHVIATNNLFSTWSAVSTTKQLGRLHILLESLNQYFLLLRENPAEKIFQLVSFDLTREGLDAPIPLSGILFKHLNHEAKLSFELICWQDNNKTQQKIGTPGKAFQRLLVGAPIGIISIDAEWSCEFVNDTFCLLTEKDDKELLGRCWTSLFDDQEEKLHTLITDLLSKGTAKAEFNLKLPGKSTKALELELKAYSTPSNRLLYAIGALVDVSERVNRQNDFYRLANFDPVTGLHNRLSIQHQLQRYIGIAQQLFQPIQILFIDLDGFKTINDLYGHHVGDILLKEVGKRISLMVRTTDIVARFGGDEFLILIPGDITNERVDAIAHKIISELINPFIIEDHKLHITASIGIASYETTSSQLNLDSETVMNDLIKHADIALYSAKNSGKNQFFRFSSTESEQITHSYSILQAFAGAISNNEFHMNYQPILDSQTGQLIAVEALLRWNSPSLGFVRPDKFISLAESHGKIIPVQKCMIDRVCHDILDLNNELDQLFKISINLSACQIVDTTHLLEFLTKFDEYKIDPARITLEITEYMVIHDSEHVQQSFKALLNKGYQLSLDDFGTGYSSLSYLASMPVKHIKLDKSFIDEIETTSHQQKLINGVINLAHALDKTLIAEGVETQEQQAILQRMGCDYIQGYLNAKPMPVKELITWVKGRHEQK